MKSVHAEADLSISNAMENNKVILCIEGEILMKDVWYLILEEFLDTKFEKNANKYLS